MGASASESMCRAHVNTSARERTMKGRFLTPGLRSMRCSELSVCLSTCSGQMSTCACRASYLGRAVFAAAAVMQHRRGARIPDDTKYAGGCHRRWMRTLVMTKKTGTFNASATPRCSLHIPTTPAAA